MDEELSCCLKKGDSVNPQIQFTSFGITVILLLKSTNCLPSVDARSIDAPAGNVIVSVHRRLAHSNKYLDLTLHIYADKTKDQQSSL